MSGLNFVFNVGPLLRLAELTNQKLDEAAERLADETVARAQQLAPYRTGFLHDHISQERTGPMHFEVVSAADYSQIVELGARGRAGRPFLMPAMEEAREKLPGVMAEALNEAAREVRRG